MNQTIAGQKRERSFLYIVRAVFYIAVKHGTRVSFFNSSIKPATVRTSLSH
ncbi:RAxF-45 family protein [Alteribacter salitolerans]|uniref:RAxF-45 family protein n=1 Tax=Alteribacter TaxID=2823237 RepID=UPI002682F0E5